MPIPEMNIVPDIDPPFYRGFGRFVRNASMPFERGWAYLSGGPVKYQDVLAKQKKEIEDFDREYLNRYYRARGVVPLTEAAKVLGEYFRRADSVQGGDYQHVAVPYVDQDAPRWRETSSVYAKYQPKPVGPFVFSEKASPEAPVQGTANAETQPPPVQGTGRITDVDVARRILADPNSAPDERMRAWAVLGIRGITPEETRYALSSYGSMVPSENENVVQYGPQPWQRYVEVTPSGGVVPDRTRPAMGAVYRAMPYGDAGNDAAAYRSMLGLGMTRQAYERRKRENAERSDARAERSASLREAEARRSMSERMGQENLAILRRQADIEEMKARSMEAIARAQDEAKRREAAEKWQRELFTIGYKHEFAKSLAEATRAAQAGEYDRQQILEIRRKIARDAVDEIQKMKPTNRINALMALPGGISREVINILGLDYFAGLPGASAILNQ